MIAGFDLDSPLVCEGIIGDGCGGGRIFFIADSSLKVYDPITKEIFPIKDNLDDVKSINKEGCTIFIKYEDRINEFDLSELK